MPCVEPGLYTGSLDLKVPMQAVLAAAHCGWDLLHSFKCGGCRISSATRVAVATG